MSEIIEPKVGMTFFHRRILNSENGPQDCTVSDVRNGMVYYRVGHERKASEYCTLERWPVISGNDLIEKARMAVSELTQDERWDLFGEYCLGCAGKQLPCHCQNDE